MVTPSNACYQFYPLSWTTTVGPSDNSLDFDVSGGGAFSIGGQVTHNGVGLSNVTVTVAGQTNVTDASGNYAFLYLCPGLYPVTAAAPNFQFNPATNYVTLSSADSNGVNFAAFEVASLSGRVVQGASGLPGVKVSVGANISFTGAGGYYTNLNLPESTNVVLVVPSLAGYGFAPSVQSLVILSNTSLPDFMAFPSLALAQLTNGAFQLIFTPAFTCQVLASMISASGSRYSAPTTSPPTHCCCNSRIPTPQIFARAFTAWGRLLRGRPRLPTGRHRPLRFARLRGGSGPGLPGGRLDRPDLLGDHLQQQPARRGLLPVPIPGDQQFPGALLPPAQIPASEDDEQLGSAPIGSGSGHDRFSAPSASPSRNPSTSPTVSIWSPLSQKRQK